MVPMFLFASPGHVGRVHISPAGEPYRKRRQVLETATGIWCNGQACIRQFPKGTRVTLKAEAKRKDEIMVFDVQFQGTALGTALRRRCQARSTCTFVVTNQATGFATYFCLTSWSYARCKARIR